MKPILDERKRGVVCGILAVGGSFQLAAQRVGCSRQTIRNTANRDPVFRKQLHEAQTNPEILFLNTIREAGQQAKFWPAAKWALQHMNPDRYTRKARTMSLSEVRELISQMVGAIAKAIPDAHVRAEVRRRIYKLTGQRLRKVKESRRGK
jgi:hypothetical protein